MKVAVIAGRELTLGFSLAGVNEERVVSSREEAADVLRSLIIDDSIGIILIEENIAREIPGEMRMVSMRKQPYPIVVIVPGWMGGPSPGAGGSRPDLESGQECKVRI